MKTRKKSTKAIAVETILIERFLEKLTKLDCECVGAIDVRDTKKQIAVQALVEYNVGKIRLIITASNIPHAFALRPLFHYFLVAAQGLSIDEVGIFAPGVGQVFLRALTPKGRNTFA